MKTKNAWPAVTFNLKPEYPAVKSSEAKDMFVNCFIEGMPCEDSDRKPIDVAVVLDRSGSMGGRKLELCKKTIAFLLEELTPVDRLALITYDTTVRTDFKLTPMDATGKHKAKLMANNLTAGSATNLSGGLLAGVEEVQSQFRLDEKPPNPVTSVLLLTDGLANEGITSSEAIVSMLDSVLESSGSSCSIYTFGYGTDHKADLLRQISDAGNGMYYFVQEIDGIALAFAECIGGLLSVVAQNLRLEVEGLHGTQILEVKTKKRITEIKKLKHFSVELGDMFAEQQRDLLIRIRVPKFGILAKMQNDTPQQILQARLSLANVLAGTFDKLEGVATIDRPRKISEEPKPDSHVCQQKNRIQTAEAIESARSQAESGNLKEARRTIDQVVESIQRDLELLTMDDAPHTQVLLADLAEAKKNMETKAKYESRGRYRMQSQTQCHFNQQSNNVELDEMELRAESRSMPQSGAYRTLNQRATMMRTFENK